MKYIYQTTHSENWRYSGFTVPFWNFGQKFVFNFLRQFCMNELGKLIGCYEVFYQHPLQISDFSSEKLRRKKIIPCFLDVFNFLPKCCSNELGKLIVCYEVDHQYFLQISDFFSERVSRKKRNSKFCAQWEKLLAKTDECKNVMENVFTWGV